MRRISLVVMLNISFAYMEWSKRNTTANLTKNYATLRWISLPLSLLARTNREFDHRERKSSDVKSNCYCERKKAHIAGRVLESSARKPQYRISFSWLLLKSINVLEINRDVPNCLKRMKNDESRAVIFTCDYPTEVDSKIYSE